MVIAGFLEYPGNASRTKPLPIWKLPDLETMAVDLVLLRANAFYEIGTS